MPRVDAEKIKRLRADIPLTQPELAEKMGLKRSTYAYKEKIGEFTEQELQQLVRIFQVSREELTNEPIKNGNGHNGNDLVISAKDQTITALNRHIDFLINENERLKKQCEVSLARLHQYAQVNAARLKTVLESQKLLSAAAEQAAPEKRRIASASERLDKLYIEILSEMVESEKV